MFKFVFQVRNLSYMISRREKIKKQFNTSRESVFYAALEFLTDKTVNLSHREVDKIVKTYRNLPDPYCKSTKKLKCTHMETKAEKAAPRRTETKTEPSKSGVVQTNVKLVHMPGKKMSESRKSLFETPKSRKSRLKLEASNKVGTKVDKGVKIETNVDKISKMETDKMEADAKSIHQEKDTIQSMKKEIDAVNSDKNNSASDDVVDVVTKDDTLNSSRASSTIENSTLVQSELETASDKVVPKSQKGKQLKKLGRPSVCKHIKSAKPEIIEKSQEKDENVEDRKKVACRKGRTRSSLPEMTPDDATCVDGSLREPNSKPVSEETDINNMEKETRAKLTAEKRDKRFPSIKLTEAEKDELVQKFPTAKNVSDHVKAELSGYFKNNKLVVSNKIRQKVQNALLSGKRRNRFGKGIVIDHSQKKIDNFFVKSPPMCDPDSPKSPTKNVSRILNELSPTRDRYEANNIERTASLRENIKVSEFHITCRSGNTPARNSPTLSDREKSVDKTGTPEDSNRRTKYDGSDIQSVKEKLFEGETKRITRSSRESTPESTSSVKSFSSCRRGRQENPILRTRSNTPSSVCKDSDKSESENICTELLQLRR